MTSANKKIGVIFDLDGVLIDTGKFHKQSWYELAEKEGFKMSDELFYSTFGMQNNIIIPMLAGRELPAEQIDRLSEWKEKRYRELITTELGLPEGAKALLDDLKSKAILLAVGSSAPRANLDFALQRLKIHDYFDALVTCEEIRNSKPAPDTFLKAAEKLSLPPSCCAVVEDSVQGVEAGKAAKMVVVAITTTRDRKDLEMADMIVDSLTELRADDFVNLLTAQTQQGPIPN
jgi:beta-phosphoglucomutase